MKQIFGEQGIPTKVISDNAGHYDSHEFKKFTAEWEFDHVTSSPRYPQSNGFIERQVRTVKDTLIKAKVSGEDPDMALLSLRNTPIDNIIPSPAELLQSRKMRGNVPVKINASDDKVQNRLSERQEKQKMYHDRGTHRLPPLVVGQHVLTQSHDTGKWSPAVVVEKCNEPRSYFVQTPNGQNLRRNRRFLKDIEPVSSKRVHFADDKENASINDNNALKSAVKETETQNYDHSVSQKDIENNENTPSDNRHLSSQYQTRSGRIVKKTERLIES